MEEGEGVDGLVEAAAEAAENDDGVLLRGRVFTEGALVSGAHAYLDVSLGLLVVDERADALHEVGRVLVGVVDYGDALAEA